MKFVLVAALAILALSTTSHQVAAESCSKDFQLGAIVRQFIDAFQKNMPCGFEPLGVPALAPFTLANYEVNYATEQLKVQGQIKNIVLSGLNKFRILEGSFNSSTNRFTYDMLFPEIQLLAEEHLKEFISIGGFPLAMDVDGLLNLKLQNLRFIEEFSLEQRLDGTPELQFQRFNFLLGGVTSSSWNKHWDNSMNKFVNEITEKFLLTMSEQIQPKAKDLFAEYVLSAENAYLAKMSMEELTEKYQQVLKALQSSDCQLSGNFV